MKNCAHIMIEIRKLLNFQGSKKNDTSAYSNTRTPNFGLA